MTFSLNKSVPEKWIWIIEYFSPSDNNLFCWAFIINVFIYEVLSIHSLSINLAVLSFNRSLACRQNNYTFKSLCHQHFRLMNSKCKISFIASMCVFLSFFLFLFEFNVNIYTCTNSTPDVCNDMFLFCAGCLSTIFYAYNAIYLVYYIWWTCDLQIYMNNMLLYDEKTQ